MPLAHDIGPMRGANGQGSGRTGRGVGGCSVLGRAEAVAWAASAERSRCSEVVSRVHCVAIGSVEPIGLRRVGGLCCGGVGSHGGGSGGDEPADCGQAHVLRCGVGNDASGEADQEGHSRGPPAEVASAIAAIVAPEPVAPLNPPSTSSVYSPPQRALWKALAAATTMTTSNRGLAPTVAEKRL